MTIDAIFCDIKFSSLKPFHFGLSEIPLQHLVPFFSPREVFSYLRPKSFRIINASLVDFFIFIIRFYLIGKRHKAKNFDILRDDKNNYIQPIIPQFSWLLQKAFGKSSLPLPLVHSLNGMIFTS